MGMMPFDHIEGRIAFYKAELGITDAQLPQWNAFADALRNGAKGMQMAIATAMQAGMPATAPARADAMVQMMSARLDAMKATAAASKALYAVLSDAQKKTADELLAEPRWACGPGAWEGDDDRMDDDQAERAPPGARWHHLATRGGGARQGTRRNPAAGRRVEDSELWVLRQLDTPHAGRGFQRHRARHR